MSARRSVWKAVAAAVIVLAGATACTPGLDTAWTDVVGVQVPISSSDGPRTVQGLYATGYTRTDRGAALAAVNILIRSSWSLGPVAYRKVISSEVLPGKSRDDLISTNDASYVQATEETPPSSDGGPIPGSNATVAGYRLVSRTSTHAVVTVVLTGISDTGALTDITFTMRLTYRHGSWRAASPPDGDWSTIAQRANTTTHLTRY